MTLRRKTLLIIGATLAGLMLVMYSLARTILLQGFADLEDQTIRRNVRRVMDALSDEFDRLEMQNSDYARWNDTCAFVQNGNKHYIRENLGDMTFADLKINLMLFLDTAGRVVHGKGYDLIGRKSVPVPPSLLRQLSPSSPLLRLRDVDSGVTGLVLLEEGPLMVSSLPVVTNEKRGPIRGALIFGRYLDNAETERLERLTHLRVDVRWFGSVPLPADYRAALPGLAKSSSILVRSLDSNTIAGYSLVRDVHENSALVVRVSMPRAIYRQGTVTVRYLIHALLITAYVFAAVSLVLLRRFVLTPLARLGANATAVGASGDLSARVPVVGRDELSKLSTAINDMLEALEKSQRRVIEAEELYHSVVEHSSDAIFLVDANTTHIQEANAACLSLLGYSFEELRSLKLHEVVEGNLPLADLGPEAGTAQRACFLGERRYCCQSGFMGFAETSVSSVFYNNREALCIVLHDVTYRKRFEDTLQAAHADLEKRVEERTADLRETNLTLHREVQVRKRMEGELETSQEQLRNLAAHLQSALEEERIRIAREVHDNLGVVLTVLKMDLLWVDRRLAERSTGREQPLQEKISSMAQLIDTIIDSVQRITTELRPAVLDHGGLVEAIGWQARGFDERTGIRCHCTFPPSSIELDRDQSTALFRIFQEILTNIARHAQATEVDIDLRLEDGRLSLEVVDNGTGISESQIHSPVSVGLLGMRERASLLGGKLRIVRNPDRGTRVTVSIPVATTQGGTHEDPEDSDRR